MKYKLVLFIGGVLFILFSSYGQDLKQNIVASSGGYSEFSDFHYTWTIGELCIESFLDSTISYSQGFNQGFNNPVFYTIRGKVHAGNSLLQKGEVRLYLANANEKFPPYQVVKINKGNFKFSYVPEGSYYIGAFPDDSISYKVTYFGDKASRLESYIIDAIGHVSDIDIHLLVNTTAINSNELINKIKLYPNPVSDMLNIELSNDINTCIIEIINIHGKLLKKVKTVGHNIQVDISELTEGFYFIHIFSNNKKYTASFIKV